MQDKEMYNDLIAESREHLQSIEPDLLTLEQKGAAVGDELINHIFRAVHSIKGGFSFFGIEPVVRLSHAMENVIGEVRDKRLVINPACTDALLRGIDKLRAMLDDTGNIDNISYTEELDLLRPFLKNNPAPAPTAQKATSDAPATSADAQLQHLLSIAPQLDEPAVHAILREGKLVYQVTFNPKTDLGPGTLPDAFLTSWEQFGDIVQCTPPRAELTSTAKKKAPEQVTVVFATVLEADLVGTAINIKPEQILSIDLSAIYKELTKKRAPLPEASATPAPTSETESAPTTADTGATAVAAPTNATDNKIEETLRVKVDLLNTLMNAAGELVLARNQLIQIMGRKAAEFPEVSKHAQGLSAIMRNALASLRRDTGTHQAANLDNEKSRVEKSVNDAFNFPFSQIQSLAAIVQNLDMVTTQLQEGIMQTRMQPLSVVFSKFPRVIRDLAKKLGKEISLAQTGQEVELDKSIIELLSDPLTHLVRNCADHGLETPQERIRAGKPAMGTVFLKAFQEGGKVIIEVEDDGAGINFGRVRDKALERGILTPEKVKTISQKELQLLIFAPGFSTVEKVSDISGRGVGMDVVKTNIERLGGTIDIESRLGKGTRIIMKLPLTLAIIPSLIVTAENRRFAVPQVSLEEIVRIRSNEVGRKIERIQNAEVLRLRGTLLPLVRLAAVLGIKPTFVDPESGDHVPDRRSRLSDRRHKPGTETEPGSESEAADKERRNQKLDRRTSVRNAVKIVVLRLESRLFGLIVDDVLDSEEIVVKPLPEYLKKCQSYAGATIMGDGRVAMILDPNGIAAIAQLDYRTFEREIAAEKDRVRKEAAKKLTDILLFTIGGPERFAIPLADVARVEKRTREEIQHIGSREFLAYDASSLNLVRLENYLPVHGPQEEAASLFLIVPKHTKPVGIYAHRVEDTIQTELNIDAEAIKGRGVCGASLINKNLTVVLDTSQLLQAVEEQLG